MSDGSRFSPAAIIERMRRQREMEVDVKRELAKSFWQFDVSAQRRPRNHRK